MSDGKYRVQKIGGHPFDKEDLEDGTFFVIRSSDLFGAPALYGYAHLLQTAIELDNQKKIFSEDERSHLDKLAVMVEGLAENWQKRGDATVPD